LLTVITSYCFKLACFCRFVELPVEWCGLPQGGQLGTVLFTRVQDGLIFFAHLIILDIYFVSDVGLSIYKCLNWR
jgi:hypothetical protein